jgi:hypothetical protein
VRLIEGKQQNRGVEFVGRVIPQLGLLWLGFNPGSLDPFSFCIAYYQMAKQNMKFGIEILLSFKTLLQRL